jgi:hypothetical protein
VDVFSCGGIHPCKGLRCCSRQLVRGRWEVKRTAGYNMITKDAEGKTFAEAVVIAHRRSAGRAFQSTAP